MQNGKGGKDSFAFISVVTFVTWVALTFSPNMSLFALYQELFVGIMVSITVAVLTYKHLPNASLRYLHPRRLGNLIVYVFVFIREMIKANLNMARIVLSPRLPIKPGIVRISTNLKPDVAKLMLGNSITLTPGTMTMEVDGNNLYIHWVYVESEDEKQAGEIIKGSFERWLGGVFS